MNFITVEENPITANSYISIVEADDLISVQSKAALWVALTDTQKQIRLIQASLMLDSAGTYADDKTDATQVLQWPRGGVVTLPYQIQIATAEIAYNYLVMGDTTSGQIKAETVGKFKWEYDISSSTPKTALTESVISLLNPLFTNYIRVRHPWASST